MQTQSGEGLATESGPIILGPYACVGWGLGLLLFSVALGFALQCGVLAVCDSQLLGRTFLRAGFWWYLLSIAVLGGPPLLLFQAISSDALYRYATFARRDSETATNIIILLLLVTMLIPMVNLLAIPIFSLMLWLLARRRMLLLDDDEITWMTPGVIVVCFILATMLTGLAAKESASPVLLAATNGLFALLFTDAVLVNRVARWKRRKRLAPSSHRAFQFSLKTLLILALGAGVWGLMLVRVFG